VAAVLLQGVAVDKPMKRTVDPAPDTDLDAVAQIAFDVAETIREEDPRRLFDELVNLCHWHPAKAAQLLMVLAAWFDPEVPVQTLWGRVEAITADRTVRAC